jgi:hypothetical protein
LECKHGYLDFLPQFSPKKSALHNEERTLERAAEAYELPPVPRSFENYLHIG